MNHQAYEHYLNQYIKEALENSDGTTRGIAEYLQGIPRPGRFSRHRDEKNKAIDEARKAFDDHRHWPVDIVISQLGLNYKELTAS